MKRFDFAAYWNTFLHWRGWQACANGWTAFVRWKGWSAFVRWKGWAAFVHWKLWHPPLLVLIGLTALSAAGLGWVFLKGMETHPVSYGVYVLAAYTLTALVITLPGLVRKTRQTIHDHPQLEHAIQDRELHFRLELYGEELINFAYGVYKIVMGVIIGSAWIGADGIYNLTQGIMQLFQILRRRKHLPKEKQWKSYRFCGWMTLVLHLTTTGLIFQMIHWGRSEEYPGFMIFATAAFAFYKLISSFIDVAKDRKHTAPIDSAVRLLDLSQAFFSLFSLQVAMFHVFGQAFPYEKLMNTLTGGAVCLLTVGMGVYMIRRANRELQNTDTQE